MVLNIDYYTKVNQTVNEITIGLLSYCFNTYDRPLFYYNFDPIMMKKLKEENKAWPKCTVLFFTLKYTI